MPLPDLSLDTQAILLDETIREPQLAEALARVHYAELCWLARSELSEIETYDLDMEEEAQNIAIHTLAEVTVRRDRLWEAPSLRAWLAGRVIEGCRRLERRQRWRRLAQRLVMSLPGSPESPLGSGGEAKRSSDPPLRAAVHKMVRRERLTLFLHTGLSLSQPEIAWVLKADLTLVDYWIRESRLKISAALPKEALVSLPRPFELEAENEALAAALRGLWPEDRLAPAGVSAGVSEGLASGIHQATGEITRRVEGAHGRRRAGITAREILLVGLVIGGLFFACRSAGLLPKEIFPKYKKSAPSVVRARSQARPTPAALFYYYYEIKEGDTLEAIAEKAGVRPPEIRELNRYNYFENANGLIARRQILLPSGPDMDWRLPPTPVIPAPPPAPLTLRSDPQAVLQRLRDSSQTWQTLWASLQQIDYGPPGYLGPPRNRYYQQMWVSQPRRAVILSNSGKSPGLVSIRYFLDGITFWSSRGMGIYNGDYEEDNWFLEQLSLLPNLSKAGLKLSIQGEETLAGREVLIVDLSGPEGDLDSRLWVDTATGVVLRRIISSPSAPGIIQWEVAVTAIAYNQNFPGELFNLKDPLLHGFARDPSGRPLESPEAFPTLSPWPATGHEPLPYLRAPAGFDPSRQPVFLQWPESWEGAEAGRDSEVRPAAGIGVFASRYSLGSLPLQEVEFGACRRSPDGRRIALNVHNAQQYGSSGRLYWFDLEAPEKAVAVGEIEQSSLNFVFSPDSQRLAYTTCDNLADCRWVSYDLQRGEETSYNIGPLYTSYLAWRPDGRALVMLVSSASRRTGGKLLVVDVQNGQWLYSTEYDPENPTLPPDAPLAEWGLEIPPAGTTEQGCMNP